MPIVHVNVSDEFRSQMKQLPHEINWSEIARRAFVDYVNSLGDLNEVTVKQMREVWAYSRPKRTKSLFSGVVNRKKRRKREYAENWSVNDIMVN